MPVASNSFDHAFDLRAQHHRVPQGVGAGGEAFVAFVNPGDHRLIVGFNFVRRVDQNQTAARYRRQLSFQLLVAMRPLSTRAAVFLEFSAQKREVAPGAARSSAGCPARAAAGGQSAASPGSSAAGRYG